MGLTKLSSGDVSAIRTVSFAAGCSAGVVFETFASKRSISTLHHRPRSFEIRATHSDLRVDHCTDVCATGLGADFGPWLGASFERSTRVRTQDGGAICSAPSFGAGRPGYYAHKTLRHEPGCIRSKELPAGCGQLSRV